MNAGQQDKKQNDIIERLVIYNRYHETSKCFELC